eukprot:4849722-Amphidinium_carterae.1
MMSPAELLRCCFSCSGLAIINYLRPAVVRELNSSLIDRLLRFSDYRLPAACSCERAKFNLDPGVNEATAQHENPETPYFVAFVKNGPPQTPCFIVFWEN